MIKDIIVALSAVFMLWVGFILIATSRMVTRNWSLFRTWRHQPRARRVKMALWLGVPLLMVFLLWMRGVAIWNYLVVPGCCPPMAFAQILVYQPGLLIALALILYWVCDLVFGDESGEDSFAAAAADRVWRRLMLAGLVLALAILAASRLH